MAETARSGLTMLDPRDSQFWQMAAKSGLITAAKLDECWRAIPPEKRTADAIDRRLARQAVNSGLITMWQAQQILLGRPHGLRIDRYILQDLIGQGGMGRVYLAKDTRLSRPVALKILSRERMSNERAVRRFRREGKVGAQLQHENLVRVYDEGEVGGMPYLVLEYISGRTVLQMINEQGHIPWGVAAELARQVALGLEHLHQKQLLHRDVNPANIMVDRDGTAKLTDLGLAIDQGDEEEDRVTRDGATVGTFDYISPEQARNSREIDVRSDIYSLGCALYHMIAGRVPFPAPSLPEKLLAHQTHVPEPLPSLVAGVPEQLDAVVRKMMSKLPGDRYARPSAVVRALAPFCARARPFEDVHTPAAGALHWNDSAPAPSVAVSTQPGSDADGGAESSGAVATLGQNGAAGTGSVDFGLDYGAEPSISESLSTARSRSSEHFLSKHKVWPWVGGALLAVLALAAVWPRGSAGTKGDGQGNGGQPPEGSTLVVPPPSPKSGIRVVYLDGSSASEANFRGAVQRAQGKPAEIVVSGSVDLKLKDDRASATQNLTIRGAEGTQPTLRLMLDETPGGFLQVSGGTLRLSGLAIEVSAPPSLSPPRLNLFSSTGSILVENCAFTALSGAQNVLPVAIDGSRARIQGSWFDGFVTALSMNIFPGSEIEVAQSIVTRFDPARAPSTQWPIALNAMPARDAQPRKVTFDHCTICGPGFLRMTGVGTTAPVEFRVDSCVTDVGSIVFWDNTAEGFPNGLKWAGSANLYDLFGTAWVVGPPDGATAVAGAPTDLATWGQGAIVESESRATDVRFVREPAGAGRKPDDYALMGVNPPKPGADPMQVMLPAEPR